MLADWRPGGRLAFRQRILPSCFSAGVAGYFRG